MFKSLLNNESALQTLKTLGVFIVVSVVLVVLSFLFAIEFSSFAVGLLKFTIAVTVVWVFDKFAVREVKTMELIGKDPVAYAIFFLGLCLLAAFCISTS